MNYKKFLYSFLAALLTVALLLSTMTVGITSVVSAASVTETSFETDAVTTYIDRIQKVTDWQDETNVEYGLSTDYAADSSSKSVKIKFNSVTVSSHQIRFTGLGAVSAGKYFNFKVYVPEDSPAYKLQLCYRRSSNKNIYGASVTYDFSGTNTMNSRKKGEWVTLSGQIPTDETEAEWVTIKVTAASGSTNTGTVFYVDSYSVTDSSLDNGKAQIMYGFEAGPETEYIRNTQTNSYGPESNVSYEISSEQKADGSNSSLKVSLTSGAAKGQYINLKLDPFKPESNKWYNLKVYVPEDSGIEKIALVYTNTSGAITKSDTYYFSDNNQVFTTDEIRAKGEWVTLSFKMPQSIELRCVGLYIESFGSSTAGSTFYIDSYSVTEVALDTIRYPDTSNLSGLHNFDVGNIGKVVSHAYDGNLIRNVQTQGYQTESNIAFIRTSEQKDGTEGKSLKVTLKDGAAKGQYINFNETNFKPAANKWYNLKVFVPEGCAAEKMALVYTNSAGTNKKSDTYYFSDNNQVFTTDELREKGKWVTLSMQIPADTQLKYVGLYIEGFGSSTAGSTFYIDSYSVTEVALDTIRYPDKTNKDILYGFEAGQKSDYIRNVQKNNYSTEENIAFIRTSEQKDGTEGKSLKVTLKDGADKGQYINFMLDPFKPEVNKWFNIKVFVPTDSSTDKLSLTYTDAVTGNIKRSDTYYFANNDTNTVVTDEIRAKGEWITLSLKVASNATLRCVGIHTESFTDSNAGAVFYVDSYSVTDYPLDTIRYDGIDNPAVRHEFDSGTKEEYLRGNVQTSAFADEKNVSITLDSNVKNQGKKSLKVALLNGAAKGQYINFIDNYFMPEPGKWYNLKVFVPADSSADKIALTYTYKKVIEGVDQWLIEKSPIYYFADNNQVFTTDEIRAKGEWVTLSFKIPEDATLRCIGIYTESFSDSNAGAVFYVDSYSVTDTALDTIRYPDKTNKEILYGFEAGQKSDYIRNVQKNDYSTEENIAFIKTKEQCADGDKSLKVTLKDGADKGQYINFSLNPFKPEGNKWYNIKVLVPEGSNIDKMALVYTDDEKGTITKSETYYFADNATNTVETDEIRTKGDWVTLSLKVLPDAVLRCVGIHIESFGESTGGSVFYIDSYSVTDSPLDPIRYANFDNLEYRYSFESGATTDYIRNTQTNTYENETKVAYTISSKVVEHGKRSLKVSFNKDAAKGQYINFSLDPFRPADNKWYNLKVFVPADSSADKIALTYTYKKVIEGVDQWLIEKSPLYYFTDNNQTFTTDEIREKGKWVTLSIKIPADSTLRCVGLYTETFGDSNAGSVLYVDSYSVTEKALDAIRYPNKSDTASMYSFEVGGKSDYIRNVQKSDYTTEEKISFIRTPEQKESGEKSLKITLGKGADKAQYINLNLNPFNPEVGKWFNLKVFVPEDSNLDKMSLTYTDNKKGTITKSETYYFANNDTNTVVTDEIRAKGQWVTLSLKVMSDADLRCVGLNIESFGDSTQGAVFYIDSYSVTDLPLDPIRYANFDNLEYRYSFETGSSTDYIRNTQTNTYLNETKVGYTISSDVFAHGSKSLKVAFYKGAAKGQYINLNTYPFNPEGDKWYNLKVFVPADSNVDKLALTYTYKKVLNGKENWLIEKSPIYYFADNNQTFTTDEIREKGKWLTLSIKIPKDTILRCIGLYTESFSDSNAGSVFYVDSYSVTEKALDTIRYPDKSDTAAMYSFEVGGKSDYIRNVQKSNYKTEEMISFIRTSEQKESGEKSLKITLGKGADKAQYINFNLNPFNPEAGKWFNLKVFVPENSNTDKLALVYTDNKTGTIKKSQLYYFADNGSVDTDEIRKTGEWVTLSLKVASNAELRCIGIYTESFGDSTEGSVFYVDSYSVTDAPLDAIRYLDMSDIAVRHGFEAGTSDDYIRNIQKLDYKEEKNINIVTTSEQKAEGNRSLKIALKKGSAKGVYVNLLLEYFKPEAGKWFNLKVFVPEGSNADKISLIYTDNKTGAIKKSDTYYFADNIENPVDTDEVRSRGSWVTLSYKVPSNVTLKCIGLYVESFKDSCEGAVFYVDSYKVTDEALDGIRYPNLNDAAVRHSFEAGAKEDYILQIQNNSYSAETKSAASISSKYASHGKRSLKISMTKGALKKQYVYLVTSYFKPEVTKENGKWFNIKVYVPEGSNANKLSLFYRKTDNNIAESDAYYFANNSTNTVITDLIREKGKWVILSFQIPKNTKLKDIGLTVSSFEESSAGATFYIDEYSVSDTPLDDIRYGVKGEKAEGMLIDFESGSAVDYIYMTQDQKWQSVLGYTSAVTSYRAADGERSLYFKTTKKTLDRVDIFFPTDTIPPKSRFVNIKVFVEEGNEGLDYVSLVYLSDNGTVSTGPSFYFANNEKGTISKDKMYQKGQWVTLSMYVPSNVNIRRAGIRFGSMGNNGFDKEIFIDSYSYSIKPLDTTRDYYFNPEVEIPEEFNPGINRVQLTSEALFNGVGIITGERVNTSAGNLRASEYSLEAKQIKDGDIYKKMLKFADGKEFSIFNIALMLKGKEVTLKESVKLTFTVPTGIDIKTAKVYYINSKGEATLLEHTVDFENLVISTNKLGYFMIMGDKADNGKLEFMKVIKQGDANTTGLLWWHWIIIAAGALVVAAGAVFIVLFIKKKKAVK